VSASTASNDRTAAEQLDAQDELAPFRSDFHIPPRPAGNDCIYLCGHSLGLAPKRAATLIGEELKAWQTLGVEGHFDSARPWVSYHEQVTKGLALLAGANDSEVVAMNSLTVNLHLLMVSFYRPHGTRHKILIERAAFSSDRYAIESQLRFHGYDPAEALVQVGPRAGEDAIRTEDVLAIIQREGKQLALALLPGVQYLTGQAFDVPVITRAARAQGCSVGWDLAHAIGNVPLSLHDWDVDFAVWCSYKYLNGSPGAIGGAFVHGRHAHAFDRPRLVGWWGHDPQSRLAMPATFEPAAGVRGWQVSNPPILATTPLIASLELFQAAGVSALHRKSQQLTAYMQSQLEAHCGERLTIITPTARGAQLSLRLHGTRDHARTVFDRLIAAGVICDWREPDIIRVAPVPLYNRYVDVWDFVHALEMALSP
jgi:kynureninase